METSFKTQLSLLSHEGKSDNMCGFTQYDKLKGTLWLFVLCRNRAIHVCFRIVDIKHRLENPKYSDCLKEGTANYFQEYASMESIGAKFNLIGSLFCDNRTQAVMLIVCHGLA